MKKTRSINKGIAIIIVVAILTSLLSMTAVAAPVTGTITVPAGATTFSIDLVVEAPSRYSGLEFGLQVSGGAAEFVSFTPTYTNSTPSPFMTRSGWQWFGFYTAANVFLGGNVGRINFTGYTGDQELTVTVRMIMTWLTSDGLETIEVETNPSHIFTVKRGEAGTEPPTPVYHTVTFDPNGGTRVGGGALVQQVLDGGSPIAPNVVRDGFVFGGWDRPLGNVTSDMTVTALWSTAGGGSGPIPPPPTTNIITVPIGTTTFKIDLWAQVDAAYAGIEFGITIGNPNVKIESFSPYYSGASVIQPYLRGDVYYFGFFAGANAFPGSPEPRYVGTVNFSGYTGDQPFEIIIVEMNVTRLVGTETVEILTEPMDIYTIQRAPVTVYHTVTFVPAGGIRTGGGQLTQSVADGEAAVAPIVTRAGFNFAGWDKEFDIITEDLTVTAQWEPAGPPDPPINPPPVYYTVTFDTAGGARTGGGALSQQVLAGGSAEAPIVEREDYTFDRWQGSYTNVNSNVTVVAIWAPIESDPEVLHTVTFVENGGEWQEGGGDLVQLVLDGEDAEEPIVIREGYVLVWDTDFTNIRADLTVTAQWELPAPIYYTVTFNLAGGTLSAGSAPLSQQVLPGGSATAPTVTRAGFTFAGWLGSYTDVQADVTVTAQWNAVTTGGGPLPPGPTDPGDDGGDDGEEIGDGDPILGDFPSNFPFIDVNQNNWFYSDVEYMYLQGLMLGTAANLFSPNGVVKRGMVVTVLYRMEGEPSVAGLENPFKDVAEGMYYTEAVIWAAENGIVLGFTSERYGPNEDVTREQLAAILHRYQEFKEDELPDVNESNEFADEGKISGYAKIPVDALVRQGVINGKGNNMFDPKGNATRAEFAAMLHRYLLALGATVEEPPEIPEEPPVEAPEE